VPRQNRGQQHNPAKPVILLISVANAIAHDRDTSAASDSSTLRVGRAWSP